MARASAPRPGAADVTREGGHGWSSRAWIGGGCRLEKASDGGAALRSMHASRRGRGGAARARWTGALKILDLKNSNDLDI